MAEKVNGFVCRLKKTGYLCGFRKADGKPNEWHTWTDQQAVEQYTGDLGEILPCVTYIGQDAPEWRDRPTCPGLWIVETPRNGRFVLTVDIGDVGFIERLIGPVLRAFGPLPEIPQELPPPSREIAHTVRLGDTWQPPTSVRVIAITPERSPRNGGSVRLVLTVIDIPEER